MTKIYNNGDGGYEALVAHGAGDPLVGSGGQTELYGLLHYIISGDRGLEIFDQADEVLYSVGDWRGLDEVVVDDLRGTLRGSEDVEVYDLDAEYWATVSLYEGVLENDKVMEALSGFYA